MPSYLSRTAYVLAMLGTGMAGGNLTGGAITSSLAPMADGASGNCGSCYACAIGSYLGHTFQYSPGLDRSGLAHFCQTTLYGPCPHGLCSVVASAEARLGSVIASAMTGDVASAVQLLDETSVAVVFNRDRRALQVFSNCNREEVIAHVPLVGTQLAVVGDRLNGLSSTLR